MDQFNPKQYWEERLSQHYDISGVGYLPLGKAFNRWMYRVRAHVFGYHLKRLHLDLAETSALDIGSGTGFYIKQLERHGVGQIMGVDLTKTATDGLKQQFPQHHFEQADISQEGLEISQAPFGLVTCFDVLFHIVEDDAFKRALTNISNLTQMGGYFIFSDNFTSEEQDGRHHISRSAEKIRAGLDAVGLKVVEFAPTFVLLNAPVASKNPLLRLYWKTLHFGLNAFNRIGLGIAGGLVGALLYPLELLLVRALSNGPSTKIVICQKSS